MRIPQIWMVALATVGITATAPPPLIQFSAATPNPALQVGIWQRFGEEQTDQVRISAPAGAVLTLEFPGSAGETQTLETRQVTFGIVNQALTTPEQAQRLILSSHKTFESAYDSARSWQSQGIHAEVTQPGEWQVWAKRGAYTPAQQQQILSQAQAASIPTVRLEQEQIESEPLLSWVVDGFRYHRTEVDISSSLGYLQVGDTLYGGSIRIQPNAYGNYTVVNGVPLETYLRGVVPHEIGPGAPQTAIEAQAILARTYALRNRHRFVADNYEICANTHCQVYKGLSGTVASADAAIRATVGQVLTYDGDLIDAVYSSTNGGVSAAFEDIWNGDPRPYLRSRIDRPADSTALDLSQPEAFRQFIQLQEGFNEVGVSRLFRWQIRKSVGELSQQFRSNQNYLGVPIPEWQQIAGLTVLSRAASGRVQELQVDLQGTDQVHSLVLVRDQIRLAFPTLPSTLFAPDPLQAGEQITGYAFNGGGFGHGVGMSQYGSYTLSRQGYTAAQILDFYYPGTTLAPLAELIADQSGETDDTASL